MTTIYATERELTVALLRCRDRAAGIRDERIRAVGAIPLAELAPPTGRYIWHDEPPQAAYADLPEGHPEGEPASGRETAAIVGTFLGFALLLAGLAYLAWAAGHGGYRWQ